MKYRQNYTTPNIFGDAAWGAYPGEKEARKARDIEAKKLRAAGQTVKVGKTDLSGFGYGSTYWLEYSKCN